MEQQVKERLTGAVILVGLLVLLVPELLTGPKRVPPAAPAQPDQAPMRSYTMDLGDSSKTNSAPVAASTTAAPSATEPAAAVSVASAPAEPDTASAPAAPAAQSVAAEDSSAAARAAASSAPAAHAADSATEPHAVTDHSAGAWTVQVATFSSRANAAHLVASLKSRGFTASISDAAKQGHKMFRVRVGNEKDRAGAQKLLGRLKGAGEKGSEIVQK